MAPTRREVKWTRSPPNWKVLELDPGRHVWRWVGGERVECRLEGEEIYRWYPLAAIAEVPTEQGTLYFPSVSCHTWRPDSYDTEHFPRRHRSTFEEAFNDIADHLREAHGIVITRP